MARPAAEARPRAWTGPAALLAPFPGRAALSLRLALICALVVLVAAMHGTPEIAISAYVVFFLNRADRVGSVALVLVLLLLVTIFIGLVMLIAACSLDYPAARLACMAVVSAVLLYLTSASKLRPVGAILAMIVGFGLDELGLLPYGEAATRALLYVWLAVAIPAGVTIGVNLLLAPSPRRLAGLRIAARLRAAAGRLRRPDASPDDFDACLREGNAQIETWIRLARLEGSADAADAAALRQATSASTAILLAVRVLAGEPTATLPAALVESAAGSLETMAAMLARGGYPVDIAPGLPGPAGLPPSARTAWVHLCEAMAHFTEAPRAGALPARPPAARPGKGFFLPDARTNPDHVAYALKTTAAAMFCYLLYTQLDWQGIHTCFITCYVVSLDTAAGTVQKLTLRLAGCAVGALAGTAAMVFIVPAIDSIGALMLLVFAGAAAAAWVAAGSPRIAYAGLQIAFAFFLCVLQGPAPGFDLTVARDRTLGILLGNAVVYLVFTRVWPVSVAGRVDRAFAALLRQWRRIPRLADDVERRAQAADALARGQAIAQDLALIPYEPPGVRPGADWVAVRRRALAELSTLEAPLFLAGGYAGGQEGVQADDHSGDHSAGDARALRAHLRRLDAIAADLMFKESAAHEPA
ncbi:fusaric acid resistance protein [Bordetella genomosp. 10]|uniref:Fusaric acid resistance protein n=1 Tax=Bordetella genomosp. 10 TaxID=1416804 RepID=A0A261S1F1_9BORD|nr:FUSC family protein [Bordetella genomosp. 10]OZI30782.1 fusaric acid resistance protein [Bordetella genomosp. 10]